MITSGQVETLPSTLQLEMLQRSISLFSSYSFEVGQCVCVVLWNVVM